MITDQLLARYPIISDQVDKTELRAVLLELERLLQRGVCGAVVEFGCYVGTTSLFIARLLQHYNQQATYHVYDSFQGLPDKTAQDFSAAGEQFKAGELFATKKQFIANFKKAGAPLPVVHKGWFHDLSPDDVPPNITFAFLDGDYYQSIHDSLQLVVPNLAPTHTIVVDDYASSALPGAARAVDEWAGARRWHVRSEASLAIIRNG